VLCQCGTRIAYRGCQRWRLDLAIIVIETMIKLFFSTRLRYMFMSGCDVSSVTIYYDDLLLI